tara:strand:+ start:333 stop:584 length:252 start_codon:yes stop_codon:yes gene_type:complete
MVKKIDKLKQSKSTDLMGQFNIKPVGELETLKSIIFDSPDTNQAKIDFLKEEVASGRYEIDPLNIANKLGETMLVDESTPEPA